MLDKSLIYRRASLYPKTLKRLDPILFGGFEKSSGPRIALYYEPNRISFSQAYPFIHYARALKRRFGASLRTRDVTLAIGSRDALIDGADIVLLQTWFRIDRETLASLADAIKARNPDCLIAFLDSFAPTDLRFAKTLDPFVDFYLTKSALKDARWYARPTVGDTNLTEYFSAKFDVGLPTRDWEVPPGFLSKVRLSPNFFTSPQLIGAFDRRHRPDFGTGAIDVHARLGLGEGDDWYPLMRRHADAAVRAIGGIQTATGTGVSHAEFMTEMANAKLCFSPFGYGEVCWRDVEAIAAGSALIKPDMSHVRTEPDLYVGGETYAPVDWDLEQLEETVRRLLGDAELRAHIAGSAFNRIANYLETERFVDQMSFLFSDEVGGAALDRPPQRAAGIGN